MKIVFGWHLDGPTCPETPDGEAFAIDAAVVGPAGLLNLLETRLGLNTPATAPARRIAQYVARLRAIDDGRSFFSRSFAADAWATARLILSRRDELAAAGWSPASRSWRSETLAVLARAEALDEPPLAGGLPDRARSILPGIPEANPIDELTLADNPERLPWVWRRLIEALAASGTNVVRATVESPRASGDLAAVQALISGREPGPLTGDATFSVVRYDNALAAGDIAAEWLASSREANADVVIIRQGNPTILDAACRRLGLPPPGGSERSPFRGALQVLPLAFETAWQPLDAERVLELLVMHGSPIPHRIGRHFANVLRDFPGTGGARWRDAWDAVVERLRHDLSEDGLDTAKRIRQIRKSVTEWKQWLEPERFDRNSGVTVKAADAICRKVERWAFKRGAANGDEIYMQAALSASHLADTIADSRIDPISKPQLDRMIDAVIGGGIPRPATLAAAAPWTTIDDATQIWGRAPAVLWWGFAEAQSRSEVDPWSRAERDELAGAGAPLQSPGDMTALRLDAERRAFLNVADRMLLIMPAASETESGATHPVWHELANLDGLGRTVVDGRTLRRGARVALGGRAWQTVRTDHRPLPPPIRTWTVPAKLVGARETESATSIESLLGCPMRWVLQYRAGLRKTGLLDMAEGNQLKGSVAHEVLARFLSGPRPDDEAVIRSTVKTILDAVLPEIASPLLLPGRRLDLDDLDRNTIESAVALSRILKQYGLSVAATERKLECSLDGGTDLAGTVDVELIDERGAPAVVELKWSNRDRYRRDEIVEGRPVQLAAYAFLVKGDGGNAFAPAAYFMIKQRRMLAADSAPFPVESRVEGPSLPSVWNAIVEVRKRTLGELGAGRVVAAGVKTEGSETVDTDANAGAQIVVDPPCSFCDYGRLCGKQALS